MCYIRIFELCDRLLLNNKIERKRCKRCPASFLQRKYVCQRECMFDIFLIYIGNYDSDNRGSNKTIQKNVGWNFANVFSWKSFWDSSTWRYNQRIFACEFDIVIWIYQCRNHAATSISSKEIWLSVKWNKVKRGNRLMPISTLSLPRKKSVIVLGPTWLPVQKP